MVYVIQVCRQLVSRSIRSCSQAVSKTVWHIPDTVFHLHIAMVYVIQFCWQLVSRSICSCSQAISKPVRHISLLCVQWKTPDDGQRNCPKHVEFHSKNKFEKLVHLVGFIIRNVTKHCSTQYLANLRKDTGFCDQHRNWHFKVQRNADQQYYCLQMYMKFQYTAGEILAKLVFVSLLTEYGEKAGHACKWHYKCFDIWTPLLWKSKHFTGF